MNYNKIVSNKTMAYNGALVSITSVFVYSIVVMIYVIIRSSSIICSVMPKEERSVILWANGFSIAYSVTIFSIVMAMISSLAGASAAVILKRSLLHFNPQFQLSKALVISFITALVLLAIQYVLLRVMLKNYMTFGYAETFLFWFGFPAILFLSVCIVGVYQLGPSHSSPFNKSIRGQ
jgi:hypothetical protein